MSSPEKLAHYRRNPDYGQGITRRRVHLHDADGVVTASLFDNYHDMKIRLHHDGERVLSFDGGMNRYPKTTCPGALAQLSVLTGALLVEGGEGLRRRADRSQHCTHLLDLAMLGLSMLSRGEQERLFEIAVTDRDAQGRQSIEVTVDGTPHLALILQNEVVQEPREWQGCALFGGFRRWASERFDGLDLDAWTLVQMTVLIAQARPYITDGPEQLPTSVGQHRRGACFTFSEPQLSVGRDIVGTVLNLTAGLPAFDPGT